MKFTDYKNKIMIYDIETFTNDFIAVFKLLGEDKTVIFSNSLTSDCGQHTLGEICYKYIIVGFNNFAFDDRVIDYILSRNKVDPQMIREQADNIINGDRQKPFKSRRFNSLDCRQDLDMNVSLKFFEAAIGQSIETSEVDFNLDRKLNEEEFQKSVEYCIEDVKATEIMFNARLENFFMPRFELCNDLKELRYSKSTMYLKNFKAMPKWATHRVPDEILELVPQEFYDVWKYDGKSDVVTNRNYPEKPSGLVYQFGCKCKASVGGYHGENDDDEHKFDIATSFDVTSMYPNIALIINALGDENSKIYKDLLDERVRIKHIEPIRQVALKLTINSIYGLLKTKSGWTKIDNPKAAESICFYGQASCHYLSKLIDDLGYKVININTDGVLFEGRMTDAERDSVFRKFTEKTLLNLEEENYENYVQSNVNNYICKDGEKYKLKGLLNSFSPYDGKFTPSHKLNYKNNYISDLMVINKLIHNKSFEQTLEENKHDLSNFQMILKATSAYPYIVNESLELVGGIHEKIFRVFATTDGQPIYKSKTMAEKHKVENVPHQVTIYNGDINDPTVTLNIDYEFYINEATRILEKNWS